MSLAVVLAAFAGGLVVLLGLQEGPTGPWLAVDVAVGAACCCALWWRARAPVPIAVALVAAAAVVATAGAANMFATYAVARRRTLRTALLVGLGNVGAGLVFAAVYPGNSSWLVTVTVNVALSAAAVAWGALAQAQGRLVQSLEDRALRAEAEQRWRADRVRGDERARIAREMHDVVAHRVSLVALHAGGLEVRPDLPPDEVRAAGRLIRRSAQDALDELRQVVGVLREDTPYGGRVPTLADIEGLAADTTAAGQPVRLEVGVDADADLPPWLARTTYRVVQESLTNAAKHAPGAATSVSVGGGPGQGLEIRVANAAATRAPTAQVDGAGAGLLGLGERVALSGGTLEHGPSADGGYAVDVTLPWPTGGRR